MSLVSLPTALMCSSSGNSKSCLWAIEELGLMTILKKFFDALNDEEEKFVAELASDRIGLLMRCAINELDLFHYNYMRLDEPTEKDREGLYILQMGVSRLVRMALTARDAFEVPVVTFRRRKDLSIRALSIASALGIIQHGRRVAQTIAAGIGRIEQLSDWEFLITIPGNIEDDSFHERRVIEYYNSEATRIFQAISSIESWRKLEGEVRDKLRELVYPFMEHYIGYGADPLLDDFFFAIASHEVGLQDGYDSYHYSAEFGGIRVQHYMLALKFIVSIAIRHVRFAEALVGKSSGVKLENILTVSADVEPFIESLRDAVNHFGALYEGYSEIDLDQARRVFDVLAYGRGSLDLIGAPGAPFPILVRCSEQGVVKILFGARSEPVRYLLEALRYHFPRDYDRNQADRERSLQRATMRVLSDAFLGLGYFENLKMRLNGVVLSDIDLVVLEKSSGTILFFQLKHQELFGFDLHAKSVRGERLNQQVSSWMSAVERWENALGGEGLRAALQLSKDWPRELHVYRVVLSRHFAFPLKQVIGVGRTAFSNWVQFYNCIQLLKQDGMSPVLADLVRALQRLQAEAEVVTFLPEPKTRYQIDKLGFTVQQRLDE